MDGETYTTKQVADMAGIHANTLRFYEEIGFISKPERRKNGYRVYTRLHVDQCALIRRAMRAEVLQNGLRKKAVEIVRLCAAMRFDEALAAVWEYRGGIDAEIRGAEEAITAVERMLRGERTRSEAVWRRRDAARALQVTPDALRTWERSGLSDGRRLEDGYRVYDADDMRRLSVIRTLRCANYSLSAILRLLNGLTERDGRSVEALLNTPDAREDIVSACDRLILSLRATYADALELARMIGAMKSRYQTLQ